VTSRLAAAIGLAFFVSELLLTLTRRSRGKGYARQDRSTLRIIWIAIAASLIAGFVAARQWHRAVFPHRMEVAWVGVAVFAFGIALRWWSIVTLGRFFTTDVAIAPDHELVETGPFRRIRHPSYTGVLLGFAGFALTTGNWVAFLVINVPIFASFVHRMNVEERALISGLGERYLRYMRRTKRLLPFVY
jgi:protein-S-isoprenylcysteine O-methyltransferase